MSRKLWFSMLAVLVATATVLGIEHLAGRVPHHLSGGEKKRVANAGVIAMEPEVLVLDEPTARTRSQGCPRSG